MSLTIQGAIDQVRSVHPAFTRYMVPDRALADFFTRDQQRLMSLALMRDRSYLAQSLSIAFDLTNQSIDAPGTAGAGTLGGLPGVVGASIAAVQATVGSAAEVSDGTIYVTGAVVSAATTTTATASGVAWTVNAYTNAIARIIWGKGANTAPRSIASNTSTQVTVSSAWEVTPDTSSVIQISAPVQFIDATFGVVTDLPAISAARGYLVKLNAQGVPYLDYTAPLVAHLASGIPLPSYFAVLGGTIRFGNGATADTDYNAQPLRLVHQASRYATRELSAYVQGSQLFLCGSRSDWSTVESIELRYIPVPPSFTARTDLFLLPDAALPCLAAQGAVFAAGRIAGIDGVPHPPSDLLVAQAQALEAAYLDSLSLTKRARIGRVRPGG